MMKRGRQREGLRECRAAWLIGVSVREYREVEAGERINIGHARRNVAESGLGLAPGLQGREPSPAA